MEVDGGPGHPITGTGGRGGVQGDRGRLPTNIVFDAKYPLFARIRPCLAIFGKISGVPPNDFDELRFWQRASPRDAQLGGAGGACPPNVG